MSNSKLVIAKSLAGAAFILALVDAVWSRQLSASRCRHRRDNLWAKHDRLLYYCVLHLIETKVASCICFADCK
jgi:hypothetical protein